MGDALLGLGTIGGLVLIILIPAMIVQDLLRIPRRHREVITRLDRIEQRLDALDRSGATADR